jgi:hypothetical protein
MTVSAVPSQLIGIPEWLDRSLHETAGQDPLGLETITTDRFLPALLPGIIANSERARAFSFYAFLLDEFRRRDFPPSMDALDAFVRAREFELAAAVQLCPNGCGGTSAGAIGADRARPAVRELPVGGRLQRRESVESILGGYGLYYRSPMRDLGSVVYAGHVLGDEEVVPVDVLNPHALGGHLAAAYRESIASTTYYRDHFLGRDPIPRDILVELAIGGCYCRLPERPEERALLRAALLDPVSETPGDVALARRRRATFALYLRALDRDPHADSAPVAFRSSVWRDFQARQTLADGHRVAIERWAAVVLKEAWQDALSVLWDQFCEQGAERAEDSIPEGLAEHDLSGFLRQDFVGSGEIDLPDDATLTYEPTMPAAEFAAAVERACTALPPDVVREHFVAAGTVAAGAALAIAVRAWLPSIDEIPAFEALARETPSNQPSLRAFYLTLDNLLARDLPLGDLVAAIVRRNVLDAHVAIAYEKLPQVFTFRFRWENGRLRFYRRHFGRFGLPGMRLAAISRIASDLGYTEAAPVGSVLTADGRAFMTEVLRG